ncbi:hypothetical protein MKW94_027344 [Papaver nudicaule]|uniref:Uncharacterized protein n=1 Tax=Papaver nudicaule TaxID=74823 RepID=A0AA42B0J4_PAPNU|nr:hypothetical protein [Papaver nudicaule]
MAAGTGSLSKEILKLTIGTSHGEKEIPREPHWAFCYSMLQKESDRFAMGLPIPPSLPLELRDAMCVYYLVLRALDTVEDDMNIPSDTKVPILENFHRHIYDRDFHFSCKHFMWYESPQSSMDQFHHISTAFLELQNELIEETAKRMGDGMAKFLLKEVETIADYNEYCHIVAGIVAVEMTKVLYSSNLMSLFFQKTHIIQDFLEDINEIPKARMHWPRQIWSTYVENLEDLTYQENSEKAVYCLNDMVNDALMHAECCLEYTSALKDPTIFRICVIPLIVAFATLVLCYNNIEVFRGGVKVSHGLYVKLIGGTKSMSDVYGAFYNFSSMLKAKTDKNYPNATKTLSRVEAIQEICENSGLLNQRSSYFEIEVEAKSYQVLEGGSSLVKEKVDPFALVAEELSLIRNRLLNMVAADEVPKLASAAKYFFELGAEGKKFRPTILLLMSSALNVSQLESAPCTVTNFSNELRTRQQRIAEITEMIHVASLLHDDVLDDAETRRGVSSVNYCMGNKLSVLAGDFLLSRACVALASLKNTEVVTLISAVVEHLVTGEVMQMAGTSEQNFSMDHYMKKTFYKTASLIANSCKAIAILAGQETEVAMLAYNYGRNLGLAFQLIDDILDFTGTTASLGNGSLSDIRHGIITAPILYAIEEFPQLQEVLDRGFSDPSDVDLALQYLGNSRGIQRATELAVNHASLAAAAINSLPRSDDDDVGISRQALLNLTQIVITRTK